ncbi:PAPA-1-domain-containing protein, partial [Basidiobolus meristosporus CBS 931.73]
LTSRQRAKVDDEFQVELLELPTETKKKNLTAEELALKRSETARRRKNQSERRAEQDKMDTINKLLKKQASRRTKKDDDEQDQKDQERIVPTKICYLQNKDGVTISFPVDANPIEGQKFTGYPPALPKCSIPGCDNVKKYRHPKLQKDICSLEHYRLLEA